VGAEVGVAIWTAFLAAFVLAFFTAFAYAELVAKYPRAAGAALYTHTAFGRPFFTFIVAFTVMSSGIASASTLARAFAGDYLGEFVDLPLVLAAIVFILIVAAINLRGISESVGVNLVLTAIEVTGLILIVAIGVAALGEGSGDFSRNFEFKEGESVFAAIVGGTALAFYAMIGFEDSVNVAEETKRPERSYPRDHSAGSRSPGRSTWSSPSPPHTSSRPVSKRLGRAAARGGGGGGRSASPPGSSPLSP
jgi:APA family basic amino acid/polyamine antiporter